MDHMLEDVKHLAMLLVVSSSACLLDRAARDRPSRLRVGATMRELAAPTASSGAALRQVSTAPQPPTLAEAHTGGGQFTQRFLRVLYAGGEIETGPMNVAKSHFSGAYGVLGMEHAVGFGTIGVELAAGWRGLRVGSTENEKHVLVAEPRVRGDIWIAEQLTLGAAMGTTLDHPGSWMFGVQLGVHSHLFDR